VALGLVSLCMNLSWRRKPLVLLGYGLAAATKPLFPLATGISSVLVARFLDRPGKGVRDALIAA
jgi:hypothetical protein